VRKSNAFEGDAQPAIPPTLSKTLQNPPKRAIGPLWQFSHVFLPIYKINGLKRYLSLILKKTAKSSFPFLKKMERLRVAPKYGLGLNKNFMFDLQRVL